MPPARQLTYIGTATPKVALCAQTFQLKPGAHTLAVQVADNDGLSATEVMRLHVNGEVRVG